MKNLIAAIVLASLVTATRGQNLFSSLPQPTRSQSGLFLVYGVPGASGPPVRPFYLRTNTDLVDLEPWTLAVSCERIKDLLWRELNVTASPRGQVFIFLHPMQSGDDSVFITSRPFGDQWNYRIDMPDVVNRERYLAAVTHVLLLELANRRADEHRAEIPLWLREGLAQQLLVPQQLDLIPPVPRWDVNGMSIARVSVEGRKPNPLARAHGILLKNPAWSFNDLSFPSVNDLEGERGDQFRSCAQLFVARLLNLKNGRNALRNLIESLPNYYNWQFALLNSFSGQFATLRDVEKWWAINVVQFTHHDLTRAWPATESWRQLDDALRPKVQVRAETNQLPLRTDVTLQTVIRDWNAMRQADALNQVMNDLGMLQVRLTPNCAMLAESYRVVLASYLKNRDEFTKNSSRRSQIGNAALVRNTLLSLDALDRKRSQLHPQEQPLADARAKPNGKRSP